MAAGTHETDPNHEEYASRVILVSMVDHYSVQRAQLDWCLTPPLIPPLNCLPTPVLLLMCRRVAVLRGVKRPEGSISCCLYLSFAPTPRSAHSQVRRSAGTRTICKAGNHGGLVNLAEKGTPFQD